MMVTFLLIGYSLRLFSTLCFGIILAYSVLLGWISDSSFRLPEAALVLLGLLFLWIGLIIVRLIIDRSVSLHMLLNPSANPEKQIQEELYTRIDDITHYRLGVFQDSKIILTPFGKIIAKLLAIIYVIMGVKI